MGLNLDLCRAFDAPYNLRCPKCGKVTKTRFDDYDIEYDHPFPKPGLIHLTAYCKHCEAKLSWKATVVADDRAQKTAERKQTRLDRETARLASLKLAEDARLQEDLKAIRYRDDLIAKVRKLEVRRKSVNPGYKTVVIEQTTNLQLMNMLAEDKPCPPK
jgi:hypothetical protein